MSFKITVLLIIYGITISACNTGNNKEVKESSAIVTNINLAGSFSISGAHALYPAVKKWSDDFMKLHPAVRIVLFIEGTGQGLDDLRSNKCQLAMISRPLTDTELGEGIWTVPVFYSPTGDRTKDIQIIPIDLDYDNEIDRKEIPFNNLDKAHRGLWMGIYPKSLCRELTFGSIGKPTDPLIIEFLKYVLTDGQNDIKSTGLCELNDVYIGYSLDKLK